MAETLEQFVQSMERGAAEMEGDFSKELEAVKDVLLKGVSESFAFGATAAGEAWPPHSEAYLKKVGAHPLLILTGKMEAAATGRGAGAIERIDDGNTLVLGVDASAFGPEEGAHWAGVHQEGSSDGRIPQREFMAVSEETTDACVALIADAILERFTK